MEPSSAFNLKWNNHSFNIVQVFMEQLSSESLVDVTLSCQGQFIKAHKMILSACSSYFQDLFNIHPIQHPVVILNGIKFSDLKTVVEFMYRGETRVLESDLNGIFAVAETLQVRGLCNVRNEYSNEEKSSVESCLYGDSVESNFLPVVIPASVTSDLSPLPSTAKQPRKRKRITENKSKVFENDSLKVAKSDDGFPAVLVSPEPPPRRPTRGTSSPKASRAGTPPLQVPLSVSSSPKLPAARVYPAKKPVSKRRGKSPKSSLSSSPLEQEDEIGIVEETDNKEIPVGSLQNENSSESLDESFQSEEMNSKELRAKKSTEQEVEGNTDVLPFVQVSLNESAADDDIDLSSSIKVNPLFIRDIDDSDTSWDDPVKLVIDLQPEESSRKKDNTVRDSCESNNYVESDKSNAKEKKDSNSKICRSKPKLKVRPASQLYVNTSDESMASANLVTSESIEDTSPLSHANAKRILLEMKERQGPRIPRPPNAFMIFANEWRKILAQENPYETNKEISKRLGVKWKSLPFDKREEYFSASKRAGEEHKRRYPNYIYSPKLARLRKSQILALRQRVHFAHLPRKSKNVKVSSNSDPLNIEGCRSGGSNTDDSFVVGEEITVKEEMLEDESNSQTLEDEFLKMVGEGHAEAVEEGREPKSVPEGSEKNSQIKNK